MKRIISIVSQRKN